jgi:hypothetical protein
VQAVPVVTGKRAWVLAGVLVPVAVLAIGTVRFVTRGPSPALYSPVNGHAGIGQAGMLADEYVSEGDIPLCLDSAGSATVTSVELVRPSGGLRIVEFGIRTIPVGDAPLGNAYGDLAALGLSTKQARHRQVTNVCDAQSRENVGLSGGPPPGTADERVELDITLTANKLPATTDGLVIHYQAGGRAGTAESSVTFALCAGSLDTCRPPG